MYETPLVQLQPEGEWSADIDAIVVYSQLRPFPTSSWDWIGLYKVSETLLYVSGGNINAKTDNNGQTDNFKIYFIPHFIYLQGLLS